MNTDKLIPFNFETNEVRTIKDEQGQPWFVAKDVCNILGLTTEQTRRLDNDEKGLRQIQTLGGYQEMVILTIDGVYELIFRSDKPKAKEFRRWLKKEVLPALVTNGTYTLGQEAPIIDIVPEPETITSLATIPVAPVSPSVVARDAKAWHSIAKLLGLQGNQLILSTVNAIKKQHDVDLLAALGMPQHLVAEDQVRHFAVSDLAKQLGISPIQLNKALAQQGFQEETRDRKNRLIWQPTEKGKPYAVLTDTGKQHSNGAPIQQLRWLETITDQLTQPQQPMLVNQ